MSDIALKTKMKTGTKIKVLARHFKDHDIQTDSTLVEHKENKSFCSYLQPILKFLMIVIFII